MKTLLALLALCVTLGRAHAIQVNNVQVLASAPTADGRVDVGTVFANALEAPLTTPNEWNCRGVVLRRNIAGAVVWAIAVGSLTDSCMAASGAAGPNTAWSQMVKSVAVLPDGRIAIGGVFTSGVKPVPPGPSCAQFEVNKCAAASPNSNGDAFVGVLTSTGAWDWSRVIGSNYQDTTNSVAVDATGGVLAVGVGHGGDPAKCWHFPGFDWCTPGVLPLQLGGPPLSTWSVGGGGNNAWMASYTAGGNWRAQAACLGKISEASAVTPAGRVSLIASSNPMVPPTLGPLTCGGTAITGPALMFDPATGAVSP